MWVFVIWVVVKLGPLFVYPKYWVTRCRIILRAQNGTLILTTTHIGPRKVMDQLPDSSDFDIFRFLKSLNPNS